MLKEVIKRLERYDIKKDLDKTILDGGVQALIISLNTTDGKTGQLKTLGVLSSGQKISSFAPYSPVTVQLKRLLGTLTNNNPSIVNLYDTGDFQGDFQITLTPNTIEIKSKDIKAKLLESKYSSDIYGLTKQNIDRLIDELLFDVFIGNIKKSLNEILKG